VQPAYWGPCRGDCQQTRRILVGLEDRPQSRVVGREGAPEHSRALWPAGIGLAIGRAVAAKAIARAQSDGSDARWTRTVPTGPGIGVGTTPVEPLAGTWRTGNLTSGSQIRPGPPPAFGSPQFQRELEAVKRLATSLTPLERAPAPFWIEKGIAPIWEPAHAVMARAKVSPARAARISALMATSAADGVISVWDVKYLHWSIRPTQADPTIPTLIPVPNYPAYSSGFSAWVGALTEVMADAFPEQSGSAPSPIPVGPESTSEGRRSYEVGPLVLITMEAGKRQV